MTSGISNRSSIVELSFYRAEFEETLNSFFLPEEQLQFTGMPVDVLPQALQDDNRHPVVILSAGTPVGFFVLHHGEDIASFTDNEKALLLRAFSIDNKHQGKGYAKAAMLQLSQFAAHHFPDFNEIVLAVNIKNLAAKQLYEKAGFQDKGIERTGSLGPQHILHLSY